MKKIKAMNQIRVLSIVLMIIFTLSSCKDWLYLEPEEGIITEEFWKSEADLKSALMGCYASMLGNNGSGGPSVPELLFLWGEVRADMLTSYRIPVGDYNLIVNGDLKSTNSFCKWNSIYRTINYCNAVIKYAPAVMEEDASLTEESMNQYRAEALAIRALMYLYLNKVYREVPLVLDPTSSDDQKLVTPKVKNQSELWDQIHDDLQEALKYAVTSFNTGRAADDKGRITKYTIYSILADFYLWRSNEGDAQLAEMACDKVINSGRFSLIQANDYWLTTLYHIGNSPEGIFELQFDSDILNPYYAMFFTNGQYRANVEVVETFFPADELIDADSADVRSDRGSYRSALNYTLWKYIGYDRTSLKSPDMATSNFIIYRYADILLMKAEALALQVVDGDPASDAKSAEAVALIQRIRSRARANSATDMGEPDTKDALLYYIMDERAREFAFEGKRWFDLLRFAKRDNYAKKSILINMLQMSAPANRLLSIQAKMQDPNYHFMPIPQADIDAGYPVLEQNPFYKE